MKQQLQHKQVQTVTMTQELRQAIDLLEMSNQDLAHYLQEQATENPFLEVGDTPEHTASRDTVITDADVRASDSHTASGATPSTAHLEPDKDLSQLLAAPTGTLREHLLSQIATTFTCPRAKHIAVHLLEELEPTGYLYTPHETLARAAGCRLEEIAPVLERLKTLDPPGIFAASLAECLKLQLLDRQIFDAPFAKLLDNLALIETGGIKKLGKRTRLSEQEIKSRIKTLRTLDPKPGLRFDTIALTHIIPDILVTYNAQNDSYDVHLNQETLPRAVVRQLEFGPRNHSTAAVHYRSTCRAKAHWIVRALQTRAKNTLEVAKEIVRYQREFFAQGPAYLKPMTLKMVANALDIHESTVSRITQNKYLGAPSGPYALKFFFNAAITNSWTGEAQSTRKIQHRIRALIDSEPESCPLSDDALMKKLTEYDIDIARRTVTKYREGLGIPSSYERKKHYRRRACA